MRDNYTQQEVLTKRLEQTLGVWMQLLCVCVCARRVQFAHCPSVCFVYFLFEPSISPRFVHKTGGVGLRLHTFFAGVF